MGNCLSNISSTKRILIFVHYNRYNELSSHVLYTLSKLRCYFKKVVFVSNSDLKGIDKERVQHYCDKIKIRENKGYDFGAWKEIIIEEGWRDLSSYDSLTLMNDTCFGPLFDMQMVFEKMEVPNVDFWGLTRYQNDNKWMPNHLEDIPEYIQSYYLCFTKKVVESSVFQDFWKKLILMSHVDNVIRIYEVYLTKILENAGFTHLVYFDNKEQNLQSGIIPLYFPDVMIASGNPFFKVKSVINFQDASFLMNLIEKVSDYPIEIIEEHFSRAFNPNESLRILHKSIIVSPNTVIELSGKTNIALHLHISETEALGGFLRCFTECKFNYALFITTDTTANENKINEQLQSKNREQNIEEIIVFDNQDDRIPSWLNIADKLQKYDVVAHFNLNKSFAKHEFWGFGNIEDVIESFIKETNHIITVFEQNKNIGIVIPDIPFIAKTETVFWDATKEICKSILSKMELKKTLDFNNISMPVRPFGNMFWYRSKALQPLFDLKLSDGRYPNKLLSMDKNRMSQAFECLPVYIAWSEGYDFRIMQNKENVLSYYKLIIMREVVLEKAKHVDRQIQEINHSYTWRIGKLFTHLPGRIKFWASMKTQIVFIMLFVVFELKYC